MTKKTWGIVFVGRPVRILILKFIITTIFGFMGIEVGQELNDDNQKLIVILQMIHWILGILLFLSIIFVPIGIYKLVTLHKQIKKNAQE